MQSDGGLVGRGVEVHDQVGFESLDEHLGNEEQQGDDPERADECQSSGDRVQVTSVKWITDRVVSIDKRNKSINK